MSGIPHFWLIFNRASLFSKSKDAPIIFNQAKISLIYQESHMYVIYSVVDWASVSNALGTYWIPHWTLQGTDINQNWGQVVI